MTLDQMKARLAVVKPKADAMWLKMQELDRAREAIRDQWSPVYDEQRNLETAIALIEKEAA